MGDVIDLRFFLARAGCIYTKAGLSPPFHLREFAEACLLDGIDLTFCVDQIISYLDQHATFYRSGSGDGTLAPLNDLIRKRWHDLHKPPRARPERTDRIWQRNEEIEVASPATDPLETSVAPTPATIAAPKKTTRPVHQKPIDRAVAFLLSELAHGELPTVVVEQAANDEGISARTLDRARSRLKIVSRRTGFGKTGQSWLFLPHPAQNAKKSDAEDP
jgi:hypothetical protein